MSLYPPPEIIIADVHVSVVDALGLKPTRNELVDEHVGKPIHSFLEGPSVDLDGNLYVVNAFFGQILRIRPNREVQIVADYHGFPNGLKIHRDGMLYIVDRINGVVRMEPASGEWESICPTERLEPGYKGLNDLVFDSAGNIYFTDQGDSHLLQPDGRVFRLNTNGGLDLLMEGLPGPNGLVLNPRETHLFVAMTYGPTVWRAELTDKEVRKVGVFQHLSGGFSGPDGMAMDVNGGLAVCHNRLGTVWMFDRLGQPVYRVCSPEVAGMKITNLAYGGPDNRTLYMTESESGQILRAEAPVPGQPMFSHM